MINKMKLDNLSFMRFRSQVALEALLRGSSIKSVTHVITFVETSGISITNTRSNPEHLNTRKIFVTNFMDDPYVCHHHYALDFSQNQLRAKKDLNQFI